MATESTKKTSRYPQGDAGQDTLRAINDIIIGAPVTLDIAGGIFETEALNLHQGYLRTRALRPSGKRVNMAYNQPVYLLQEADGDMLLFVQLRFMQQAARGSDDDMFRIVRSTFVAVSAQSHRVPMQGFCDVVVFSTYDRRDALLFDKAPIENLSECGIGLVLPQKLHHGTFAECNFVLPDGEAMLLSARTTHSRLAEGGAYSREGLEFLDITPAQRKRIRRCLFMEMARCLRES